MRFLLDQALILGIITKEQFNDDMERKLKDFRNICIEYARPKPEFSEGTITIEEHKSQIQYIKNQFEGQKRYYEDRLEDAYNIVRNLERALVEGL